MILVAISLLFIPALYTYTDNWAMYDILNDFGVVFASFAVYTSCPMRWWRKKILSVVFVIASVAVMFHNIAVDLELFYSEHIAIISIVVIAISLIILTPYLMDRWDAMPSDKIEYGYIYEIIGKPRTELQMLFFILSGGIGGKFSITDGNTCIYMCRRTSNAVEEKLDIDKIKGCKIVKVCKNSEANAIVYRSKIGKPFSLWRNCFWLTRGFK